MKITGRQIRGARALLGWTMEELAEKTGTTRITIRQIENGDVQPQERTLTKIFTALDRAGMEFFEDEGIRIRKQSTRSYSGREGYRQLLDHIYETLQDGGVIRQFNFDDMRYMPSEETLAEEHFERMMEIEGLDAKVLSAKALSKDALPYCEYRTLDKKLTDMTPWYLYGDYVVHSLFEKGSKLEFVTIQSKLLVERYLKEFDIFWKDSAPSQDKKSRSKKKK